MPLYPSSATAQYKPTLHVRMKMKSKQRIRLPFISEIIHLCISTFINELTEVQEVQETQVNVQPRKVKPVP
jgi:hypothetical protein